MTKPQVTFNIIGHIQTDFAEKFGIPRQSGLVNTLKATIIFEPEYRNPDAFKGIEDFSHVWLIWLFSETMHDQWSPTVRPPKLGGNRRKGVFATRSPFRPNPVGLSCVKLESFEIDAKYGPVLHVRGADLMDGTPILDIKPYLPYTESHTDAVGGFADTHIHDRLTVQCPEHLLHRIMPEKQEALLEVLAGDPRPAYHHDSDRVYGFIFDGMNVQFKVNNQILTVQDIQKQNNQ